MTNISDDKYIDLQRALPTNDPLYFETDAIYYEVDGTSPTHPHEEIIKEEPLYCETDIYDHAYSYTWLSLYFFISHHWWDETATSTQEHFFLQVGWVEKFEVKVKNPGNEDAITGVYLRQNKFVPSTSCLRDIETGLLRRREEVLGTSLKIELRVLTCNDSIIREWRGSL